MQSLIVVRSFGPYQIGDVITDEHAIEAILSSEHLTHVVRILPLNEE